MKLWSPYKGFSKGQGIYNHCSNEHEYSTSHPKKEGKEPSSNCACDICFKDVAYTYVDVLTNVLKYV